MKLIRNQIFGQKYSLGKLLFTTKSQLSIYKIQFVGTTSPFNWYYIDKNNGSIIANGTSGVGDQHIIADLSASSGEADFIIDVDDTGNGIYYLRQTYHNVNMTYFDVTTLPLLNYWQLQNGTTYELEVNNPNNAVLEKLYPISNTVLKNLDLIHNSVNLKYLYLRGNTSIINTPVIELTRFKDTLILISFQQNDIVKIDTVDFSQFSNLTYLYLNKIFVPAGNVENVYTVDFTKIKTLKLYYHNSRIKNLETANLSGLQYLYLYATNQSVTYDFTQIVGGMPAIKELLIGINVPSLPILNIDNKPELWYIYLSVNNNLTNVNLTNIPKLKWVFLENKACTITSITLDVTSKQKLEKIYALGNNLVELDLSTAPILNSLNVNSSQTLKKVNLTGRTLTGLPLSHTVGRDICFLVDDVNDPQIANWNLKPTDVVTSDINVYNNFT